MLVDEQNGLRYPHFLQELEEKNWADSTNMGNEIL